MLIDQIKQENLTALKEKNNVKRAILSVIINKYMLVTIEAKGSSKHVGDEDLIKIMQKTIKELEEEAENYKHIGNLVEYENIVYQQEVIKKYLPELLSKEEIKNIILPLEDKSIPSVMKHFKTNYGGKCDMKIVLEVLKNLN